MPPTDGSAATTQAAAITLPLWGWAVFAGIVLTALLVDLLCFEKHPHRRGIKESAVWSAVWILLAVLFGAGVWGMGGGTAGSQFFAAYLVEKSLSVDNLFIFLVIFRFFKIEPKYQPRVLFWGILGALIMRGVLIGAGTTLLQHFNWLMYVFGAVLLFTGVKLLLSDEQSYDPSKTWAFRWARKLLPFTDQLHGEHFFALQPMNGAGGRMRRVATPLFLVLVIVEATDLVFAVDSIPACLGISQDTFIVYSSNVFAILGLRALYFLLSGMLGSLRFLKPALCFVLLFIGVKMIFSEAAKEYISPEWLQVIRVTKDEAGHLELAGLPFSYFSLAVVGGSLGLAVAASLLFPGRGAPEAAGGSESGGAGRDERRV